MTEEEDRKKFSTFWLSEAEALARLKLEDEKFSKRSFILPLPVFYKRLRTYSSALLSHPESKPTQY